MDRHVGDRCGTATQDHTDMKNRINKIKTNEGDSHALQDQFAICRARYLHLERVLERQNLISLQFRKSGFSDTFCVHGQRKHEY